MRKIISVSPLSDFRLQVTFADGGQGCLDMKPFLDFGVFKRLKDPGEFDRARVSFGTVEWACGPDLDPEWIEKHALIHQPG